MITTLTDVTAADVASALVRLRAEGGAVTLGHVLTLVISAPDDRTAEESIAAASKASFEHPCRIVALVPAATQADPELSAQIRVGSDAGAGDVIVLHVGGGAATAPATLVSPFLLPDAPLVAWWPAEPPPIPAEDPIGALAQRRITDALACADPAATLRQLASSYVPGDTDLSWARGTPWRALLAAMLDSPPHGPVTAAWVNGQGLRPTVDLVAGWLASRLSCPVRTTRVPSRSLTEVGIQRPGGTAILSRDGDGPTAIMRRAGVPDQAVHLPLRTVADCLMEELRYLAPDPAYGRALGAIRSLTY